jgi:hypothetical protein
MIITRLVKDNIREGVMRASLLGQAFLTWLILFSASPAYAWDRGQTDTFAVLPDLPGNAPVAIEGLTVGPDGTVYTPTFGINSKGPVAAPPHCFPSGRMGHCSTTSPWSTPRQVRRRSRA